jgi:hypothetical protein
LIREVLLAWEITYVLRSSSWQVFIQMTARVIYQSKNSILGLNASKTSPYKPMKPEVSPFQKRSLLLENKGENHVEHGAITPFVGMSAPACNVAP